jgi:hypothetical protein
MRTSRLAVACFAAAAATGALAGCGSPNSTSSSTASGSPPPTASSTSASPTGGAGGTAGTGGTSAAGTATPRGATSSGATSSGATSGGATSGGATSGPSGPTRCLSSNLEASLRAAEGTAGSVVHALVLTNRGRTSCTLKGFPGVSYVAGSAGKQVGPAAVRVGPAGAVVRLGPGRSAQALVAFARTGNFDPAACQPTDVRGLRVFPPGGRAALFVPAPGTGCAGQTRSPQLQVRAVTAA